QKQCGQTIVKIYRVNEDGVSAKVSIDSTASKSSEEYANYMKWTGQQSFTTDDRGNYDVTFYWTLSDGRYLSDTKHVTVNVLHPGISKSVNIAYSEAGDNEITYTVTYTNSEFSSPITFGILDILPFKGDTRVGYKDDNQGTTGSDVRFNLKSMTVKQSGTATISGVYYSQSDSVRDWLTNGNREAAQNLNVGNDGKVQDTSGQWNNIIGSTGGRGTYTPNADNVTAIAVSGVQLGVSESITVTITLQYDGVQNDLYVNNAFFTASDMEGHNLFNGCSKPVSTNVVGRSINGYVWLDQNGDGIVGKDEQRFKSVTVSLYHINDEGKFVDTGESATTDQNGYYSFTNLSQGEYKIAVEKNKNPHLDTNTESYLFGKFTPTKKLLEAKAESVIGSRNLAEAELNDNSEIISYFIQSDMPTAFEIYRRIYTNNINATCDNCSYQKSYLNIGLTTPLCSITLYKRGEDDELLNGAAFKLEKYNKETQKWDEIKYDEEGYAVSDDTAEGTSKFVTGEKMPDGTQEKGKIYLPNLPEGKYRLTEVGAAEGYAPLLVTVNVELPYKIKTSEIEGYKADSLVKPSDLTKPDYTDGEYSYYRNITFTVKNAKDINRDLPLTGSDSFTWAVITGAALIILGAAAVSYGVYRKKRENAK
ncbi:SdrD B-like domain-containing protein, partial [Oscillospiraceae bacterium LCP25S3_E3]